MLKCKPQSYCSFVEDLRAAHEVRMEAMRQEKIRQMGGKQQLEDTKSMAIDLTGMAKAVLQEQKKYFKDQTQYEKLIRKLNQQQDELMDN